jgi:hypothetical protein
VGVLLLSALTTGQWVKIYLEPFDPVDFIRYQMEATATGSHPTNSEKEMRLALKRAGVGDTLLATAVKPEIEEAYTLLTQLTNGASLRLRQIKGSLLGQTPIFSYADNIRRVRALVQAHLEALHRDTRFPGFFFHATKIEI